MWLRKLKGMANLTIVTYMKLPAKWDEVPVRCPWLCCLSRCLSVVHDVAACPYLRMKRHRSCPYHKRRSSNSNRHLKEEFEPGGTSLLEPATTQLSKSERITKSWHFKHRNPLKPSHDSHQPMKSPLLLFIFCSQPALAGLLSATIKFRHYTEESSCPQKYMYRLWVYLMLLFLIH